MLVLCRGVNDKVVFPTLGITVDILRVDGNKVRLGIDAPREIPVHRHEVVDRIKEFGEEILPLRPVEKDLGHAIRNRLNAASLGLHVLHCKLEAGNTENAETVIFSIFKELKAIEDEVQGRAPVRKNEAETAAMGEARRVLVVEDDDNERHLLSGYLEMCGFHVESAIDGLQAMVKLTKEERPDVVLLDMRIPRFDGKKTISAIRTNPDYRDLKVFGVSGEQRSELKIPLGKDGVDRWFSKPLNPQELVSAIRDELATEYVLA